MYSLADLFKQAIDHPLTTKMVYNGRVSGLTKGCKITEDALTGDVTIESITGQGDYYREITIEEYRVFKEKGFFYGSQYTALHSIKLKLSQIDKLIRAENNNKKRATKIASLKTKREEVINIYNQINAKLKSL